MSYRTIKRVLGESSLERKCRILFGIAMLVLMVTTYGWYGNRTKRLVNENTRSNCRYLVESVVLKTHFEELGSDSRELAKEIAEGSGSVDYSNTYLSLEPSDSQYVQMPSGTWEREALVQLQKRYQQEMDKQREELKDTNTDGDTLTQEEPVTTTTTVQPIYETYRGAAPIEADIIEGDKYHYVQVIRWKDSCITCHRGNYGTRPGEDLPFRAVRITLPYANTQRAVNKNYAILLATAIVTVFLSMLALYVVVRYVIVKPLQHLQQVSEAVGQGNYEARAHIETNDEFEDLADAYNRMLRHLVSTQTELQQVNTDLDGKVDQLAHANMQLYEMNRVKSDFLASVSHELRTPLNIIIGFSDVLGGIDSLSEREKKYVSNIGNSGKALRGLINDILDLAKLESGRMQIQPAKFEIEPVLQTQCDLVTKMVEEKNIGLSIDCNHAPKEVFQDQSKIQQIITNLLSNAIKFTPDGGRITVAVAADEVIDGQEPTFAITVEDTGVGIAEEDREVIFEKFRQATATRGPDNLTREYSGTGLGLSIVQELCKMLQGEITFTSQLGTGSAFCVRLPIHLEPPPLDPGDQLLEPVDWTSVDGTAS